MTRHKYILIVIFLLTIGGILSSCSDNFLQRDSLTESTTETFWKTESDAMMGLTACYDALQSNFLYNSDQWSLGPLYLECLSDNGGHFNWSGWMCGYELPLGIQTPSSWIFSSYWSACYEVIGRCNILISNIERVDADEAVINRYRAEAIVLRSLIYTNLTITFQDVPYITEPLTIDNAEVAKTDRATIVETVIRDLKDAVEMLPKTADRGRITKGAAYAILGRIALYNEKWDDAIDAYREVLNLGYSLYPDYSMLFTQQGETSAEIILAARYEGPGLSEGTAFNAHWNCPIESINGTLDLADAYYCTDGKPTTDTNYGELTTSGGLDVSKPNPAHFENRDPRLYATLFVPGMKWNGVGGLDASSSNPYRYIYGGSSAALSTVYVYKYFDPLDTSDSWDNGQDFYIIRYPEVLLSLAEALIQKGSYSEAEVCSLVNQVRSRVNMPNVEDVEGTGLLKERLLEIVKHERRVELAFEGLRLFDLYRWKELEKSINNIELERTRFGLSYETRKYNGEKDYVWPLPTSEVDANSKLIQHDLWK